MDSNLMSTVLISGGYWEADVYTCCARVIHRGKTQEDTVRRVCVYLTAQGCDAPLEAE